MPVEPTPLPGRPARRAAAPELPGDDRPYRDLPQFGRREPSDGLCLLLSLVVVGGLIVAALAGGAS